MRTTQLQPMPAIDHEAGGPLSVLVRAIRWATRVWGERAQKARSQLIAQSRRWL